jgi:hypothetical protein
MVCPLILHRKGPTSDRVANYNQGTVLPPRSLSFLMCSAQNSIESHTLDMQESTKLLVQGVFSMKSAKEMQKIRYNLLRFFFFFF